MMNESRLNRTASRANSFLGKLLFRALGTLCAIAAIGAGWLLWYAVSDWNPETSLVGAILSGVFLIGAVWATFYCFSSKRTLIEALDAMEGVPGDLPRRRDESN